ncbi:MAG TPA: hypothetical protein VJ808_10900, partial [Gemmatimonadales bacterium]|nr:hypothetical protein [Gemmatimonadales bacterium]
MYRIELSPGEETAFRSIEELAVAIRRKVVTSRARIYHNATSRWLPIQFHPHYKIALSMPLTQADLVAGPRVAPLSALKLGEPQQPAVPPSSVSREAATQAALAAWPEPKPVSSKSTPAVAGYDRQEAVPLPAPRKSRAPAPEARRVERPRNRAEPRTVLQPRTAELQPLPAAPPMPQRPRVVEPVVWLEPVRSEPPRRRRKLKRSLRVALAGAVLIACAHLAVSGATGPSPGVASRPRQLIKVPAEALKDVTPRTVAAVMPVLQTIPIPTGKPALQPAVSPARGSQPSAQPQVIGSAPVAPVLDSTQSAAAPIETAPDAGKLNHSIPVKVEP